ncbi:hypothetical protein ACRAVF_03030 [Bradyrhizobium oligotrophicum S58]
MASYRIKAIGAGFEVGTAEQAVLVCRSLKTARRAVADAQRLERMPPKPIPGARRRRVRRPLAERRMPRAARRPRSSSCRMARLCAAD